MKWRKMNEKDPMTNTSKKNTIDEEVSKLIRYTYSHFLDVSKNEGTAKWSDCQLKGIGIVSKILWKNIDVQRNSWKFVNRNQRILRLESEQ